ncbi:MAG TPA: ATP-binding protein [Fimbriimonadaceae bacterium]|nr:ATP-binding protein [Fimbriimonadaceae bacterium]
MLWFFARKRGDLPFRHLFWLFGLFIVACGTTHLMGFLVFYHPMYRLDGVIKLITAVASWGTVLALVPITPKALAMKSPEELEREIEQRKRTEEKLTVAKMELEQRTEELEEAYQELEAFSYSVSHDLRSPLRGMAAMSRIIAEDNAETLDDESRENLKTLEAEAGRMAQIISDLLEFARLGRKSMEFVEVDLSTLASKIGDRVRRQQGVEAEVHVQEGLTVNADPELLELALTNLIDNAVKYSAPKTRPIIEVGSVHRGSSTVYFVRDNGMGLPPEYQHKIFQPFERLHRGADIPGTGIGLANVKRIVERHGGRIWVESQQGLGATFYFSLK